ncbi:MAG: NAD(P)(+) transhydrogenase (Re/Si-specific) subunit beta [Clostridia bacterium]|nr:NAD(P)(+) transhydrogenase (Re/Si-specific) subunit beta [Clostridia bacterium]
MEYILVSIFVIASIVGYFLIKNVPSLLHTPLMSGMNALSGITVLGALVATTLSVTVNNSVMGGIIGAVAIALAMINVVGGFVVTHKMLKMIAKDNSKKWIYLAIGGFALVIVALVILMACMGNSPLLYYILCGLLSVGVLAGIALLSKVQLSVMGNILSAVCMVLAIVITAVKYGIFTAWIYILLGLLAGIAVGLYFALKVKMIQMPQMVALLNGLGGLASAIVGAFAMIDIGGDTGAFSCVTSIIALSVGMLTLIGSLVAAGKLAKILPQKSVVYKGHQLMTIISLAVVAVCIVLFGVIPFSMPLAVVMLIVGTLFSSFFGYIFAIRVGGADMPITISLLNSLSGVAGAIAGLAIKDVLLVSVGGIVGASGLLLTQIMCKSMNRKLSTILLGKTSLTESGHPQSQSSASIVDNQSQVDSQPVQQIIKEQQPTLDPIQVLRNARDVIIVPGYGMAIAQAQHLVKELADKLQSNGAKIRYAVHPVAGRMPGHMNVLLCEANVDYEDLYEMEVINPDFATADAVIVVGANDVLNPSARNAEGTPIYGMPILDVDKCSNIFIFNYDTKPGYAGVDNPIYHRTDGVYMYLGNASDTLAQVLSQL